MINHHTKSNYFIFAVTSYFICIITYFTLFSYLNLSAVNRYRKTFSIEIFLKKLSKTHFTLNGNNFIFASLSKLYIVIQF